MAGKRVIGTGLAPSRLPLRHREPSANHSRTTSRLFLLPFRLNLQMLSPRIRDWRLFSSQS